MTPKIRWPANPWWLVWLATMALTATAVGLLAALEISPSGRAAAGVDVYGVMFLVLAPLYASVGAVIVSRGAGNRVGLVISGLGVLLAVEDFVTITSAYSTTPAGAWVVGRVWLDWMGSWVWVPAVVGALALLPIYFPDGRLPSRRWRPLVLVIAISGGAAWLGIAFSPATDFSSIPSFVNPVGLAFLQPATKVLRLLYILGLLAGTLGGAASLVVRYRRGSADERHQVKWFAAAFALVAVVLAVYSAGTGVLSIPTPDWLIGAILCSGLSVIPVVVAIAVLKYRLYDIDVVISRALVFGSLAALITVIYVTIVVVVGALVGNGGRPNLLLSIVATTVVAVGFQAVRERVQRVANRLVYGKRATPYEVLSNFSERVAESYAADEVLPRMARVLADGTGADRADVWLGSGKKLRRAASWPQDAEPGVPTRSVEVRYRGEALGTLSVTKRGGESLTPVEEKLLDDLAHQAGLVLKNVGLTAELLQRLDDLRASRQRLVAAQDEERRRLERNLHDGAQQNLVALKVKLGLVEMLTEKDPDKARRLLQEIKGDADEALETLRDLARGIYPPLLADKGLAAALESQARKATVPVTIEAVGIRRYPPEIEAAVYFCCLEGLQNVQKYGSAARAVVHLSDSSGELSFEVKDDGIGFDPGTTKRGSGLQNIEDRLEAMGGTLSLTSAPGRGTLLAGTIPILELAAA